MLYKSVPHDFCLHCFTKGVLTKDSHTCQARMSYKSARQVPYKSAHKGPRQLIFSLPQISGRALGVLPPATHMRPEFPRLQATAEIARHERTRCAIDNAADLHGAILKEPGSKEGILSAGTDLYYTTIKGARNSNKKVPDKINTAPALQKTYTSKDPKQLQNDSFRPTLVKNRFLGTSYFHPKSKLLSKIEPNSKLFGEIHISLA